MSKQYDEFKKRTHESADVIQKAKGMGVVSDEFASGFERAMWEAREIFMRVEDKFNPTTQERKER